jgi:hypothetical protein
VRRMELSDALVLLAVIAVAGGAGCGSSKSLTIDSSTENGLFTWEHGKYNWNLTWNRWERLAARGTRRQLVHAIHRDVAGMRRDEAEEQRGIRQISDAQFRERLTTILLADQSMREHMNRLTRARRATAQREELRAIRRGIQREKGARRQLAAFLKDHGLKLPANAQAP